MTLAPGVTARDAAAAVEDAWLKTLGTPVSDSLTWEQAGADSLASLHLQLHLERALRRKLAFDVIRPDMTAADLVPALIDRPAAAVPAAVPPTLFLVPGMLGDEPILAAFRREFLNRLRFVVVDLPEVTESALTLGDMAATGAQTARRIEQLQPHGDIFLAGYSFGGSVAFEAARVLQAAGRHVPLLVIMDAAFATAGAPPADTRPRPLRMLLRRAAASDRIRRATLAALRPLSPRHVLTIRRHLLGHFRTMARNRWRPTPLEVPSLLAVSQQFAPSIVERWARLCPTLHVVALPSGHTDLFEAAALAILVPAVENAVRAAQHRKAAP
ncbi:MAG: hypothetical protein NVSMB10_09990 [Steroidobacteraceae bacterium]